MRAPYRLGGSMSQIGQFRSSSQVAERRSTGTSRAGLQELLAEAYERGFSQSVLPTVGLEEELILVDPESLEPSSEAERILAASLTKRQERDLCHSRRSRLTDRHHEPIVLFAYQSLMASRGRQW